MDDQRHRGLQPLQFEALIGWKFSRSVSALRGRAGQKGTLGRDGTVSFGRCEGVRVPWRAGRSGPFCLARQQLQRA